MCPLAMFYPTSASQARSCGAHTANARYGALTPLPDYTSTDAALLQELANWQPKDDLNELAYLFDAALLTFPPTSPIVVPTPAGMAHTVSPTDLQCQLAALPPDFYSAEAAPLTDTPSTLFAVLQAEAPQSITYDNIKRRPSCIAILRLRRNAVFVPRVVTDAILDQVASGFAIANTAICQSPAELQPEVKSKCVTLEHGSCTTDKKSPKGYSTRVNNILDEWTARNKANPYPTPQDKLRLMRETGLTKMQLKNWLCNIRRRKLPNTIRRPKKDVRAYRR